MMEQRTFLRAVTVCLGMVLLSVPLWAVPALINNWRGGSILEDF